MEAERDAELASALAVEERLLITQSLLDEERSKWLGPLALVAKHRVQRYLQVRGEPPSIPTLPVSTHQAQMSAARVLPELAEKHPQRWTALDVIRIYLHQTYTIRVGGGAPRVRHWIKACEIPVDAVRELRLAGVGAILDTQYLEQAPFPLYSHEMNAGVRERALALSRESLSEYATRKQAAPWMKLFTSGKRNDAFAVFTLLTAASGERQPHWGVCVDTLLESFLGDTDAFREAKKVLGPNKWSSPDGVPYTLGDLKPYLLGHTRSGVYGLPMLFEYICDQVFDNTLSGQPYIDRCHAALRVGDGMEAAGPEQLAMLLQAFLAMKNCERWALKVAFESWSRRLREGDDTSLLKLLEDHVFTHVADRADELVSHPDEEAKRLRSDAERATRERTEQKGSSSSGGYGSSRGSAGAAAAAGSGRSDAGGKPPSWKPAAKRLKGARTVEQVRDAWKCPCGTTPVHGHHRCPSRSHEDKEAAAAAARDASPAAWALIREAFPHVPRV